MIPVNPEIEDYMRSLLTQTGHPILVEMEEFVRSRSFPIVNRLVGVFLGTQARMINAKRVFEIRAKTARTSEAWINSIFLVKNLMVLLKVFIAFAHATIKIAN